MSDVVITALISGAVTLMGVLAANNKSQAVTDTKIEELTREVRQHNNFARRVPVLEQQMAAVTADIKELQGLHERV